MEKYQLDYYKGLTSEEQSILKLAALKAQLNYSNFREPFVSTLGVTQKAVKSCLEDAGKQNIFKKVNGFGDNSYHVSIPFMLYIYPELSDFEEEWQAINKELDYYHYYSEDKSLLYFRNFLYCLLHDPNNLASAQNTLLNYSKTPNLGQVAEIFDYPVYDKLLSRINSDFLHTLVAQRLNQSLIELAPMSQVRQLIGNIKKQLASAEVDKFPFDERDTDFYLGNFSIKDPVPSYNMAIYHLVKGDVNTALTYFDTTLKLQRKDLKGLQLPINPYYTIYYLTALLQIDSEASVARCQLILKGLEKNSYTIFDFYFKAVIDNLVNDRPSKKEISDNLLAYIKQKNDDLQTLVFICICFLADIKPDSSLQEAMRSVIKKACAADNLILAYEAAFAMQQWFAVCEDEDFYKQLCQRMSYQPVLSSIQRQDEWEKSMNLLFSFGVNGKNTLTKENSSRVIYIFSPATKQIQPVLQSRNTKGVWSNGRNIALKTFYESRVAGMTSQDIKISKTLKYYSSYYNNYYEFTERALIELVGHPHILLAGGKEIPVEFIAAQPVIKVTKSSKGYLLTTDLTNFSDKVQFVKETNTRYKIYDLSVHQLNIVRVLAEQHLIVPEQGKGKLIQLLGKISKYATVHSDLLTTEDQSVSIKRIKPDNRIRIQLLPFGDGLKAELFVKPFGNHPPYCKPGSGGKVLIANQNGSQLQVKRDLKQESEFADAILSDIQSLESIEMSDELIAFDDPKDSLYLLDIIAAHKDKCVVEWPEGEKYKIRATANFTNLNLQVKSKINWFELTGELKVDENTVLSIQELMTLVSKSKNRFIELANGEFLALSNEMRKRLGELYSYATSGKEGLRINKFASVALGDFFDDVENLKADKSWKEFRKRIEKAEVTDLQLPITMQAELRPYQEEGFRWMIRLADWEGGACLADDMGLGKTIQALAVLLHRMSAGPAFVVCPVSVVGNWIAEAGRFAPALNIKLLGTSNRKQILQTLEAGDVMITSYGLLQSEEKLFAETTFATVILDEAHVIKNFATKTSKATMQLNASFRIALTGTPLQNHMGEIWNLFNFINPGLLGSMQHFNETFMKADNEHTRKYLKKLIAPFILRRTKSAVLEELPPKTEIVKKVQLSAQEMAFYEALRRQALLNIESDDCNQGTKHLRALAEITKLRQASCNPLLVDADINIASSKLAAFMEIVDELIENKHHALVFSQFVKHLTIVRQELDRKGIHYQYMDGSTPMQERERCVKQFQNGQGELFLISLKAGGLGLNLTAADYVIHLDPWWNPAIEDQASDRAHRIGQSRPVTIYRLVAENTIEEKIIELHNTKRGLAESLLEGSDQSARLSLNELVSLIQETVAI